MSDSVDEQAPNYIWAGNCGCGTNDSWFSIFDILHIAYATSWDMYRLVSKATSEVSFSGCHDYRNKNKLKWCNIE